MPPSDEGRAALEQILDARVTVVIGASDAGKTTLTAELASALALRGERVGVVDADVGQSEIGPPTTVGLGRVTSRIGRLSEATLIAFQFVGVASPARDVRSVVDATRRMVERARAEGLDRVLVDTSGLVLGWPGRMLKERKILAVDPDVVLVLQRGEECEPIVAPYAGRSRPRIVRGPVRGRPGSRSQAARREHRLRALDAYLGGARVLEVPRSAIPIELPRGVSPDGIVGALCGLDGAEGDTLALGVVHAVDDDAVTVIAPLAGLERVSRVRVGRERKDGTPLASAPARRGREGAA